MTSFNSAGSSATTARSWSASRKPVRTLFPRRSTIWGRFTIFLPSRLTCLRRSEAEVRTR